HAIKQFPDTEVADTKDHPRGGQSKQSQGIQLVPLSLRHAIKRYLRDQDKAQMNLKVLLLSASFERTKGTCTELAATATGGVLIDDLRAPSGSEQQAARWKVRYAYGDIGLQYREYETVTYVASRMLAIYAACHRVLHEVQEQLSLLLLSSAR
ncbi:Os10g0520950, partial [Oryza sativa Japonica Group]